MARPYAGAPVSEAFRERWLSGKQVGDKRPVGMVEIRRGRLVRHMHPYPGLGYPAFGEYPGVYSHGFWYPQWQVNSDWMTLDGVQNIRLEQSFDNNGVSTCTLKMDNKSLVPTTGAAGILYHLVEEGYYSPLRGYVAPRRPDPGVKKTPFFNKLPNAQIRIWQGYGEDEMVVTFLGLIDDVETTSRPNEITITARDFGGVLVDEFFFGWAKEKLITPPLTFAPRPMVESERLVGGAARASSTRTGDRASVVVGPNFDNPNSAWHSDTVSSPDRTEWIEISVPEGRYSRIFLSVPFDNMHAYIGIKPQPRVGATYSVADGNKPASPTIPPTFDGHDISPELGSEGFWNPNHIQVPGSTNGGWSYFKEIPATTKGHGRHISLGGTFYVGDGTKIRIGFRNLGKAPNGYHAAVHRFQAERREFTKAALKGRYVVIDDVADIIRCCLRWAGFKGWEIENTGTNLQEPFVCDQSKTFMDVINEVKDMVGWTFFIGEPRDYNNDQDLGYPIFRNNRVLESHTAKTEFIDDSLLLTDAKVKISNKDEKGMIRCRGIAKDDGVTLGQDSLKRIMFAYIPPWIGEQSSKVAGVIKPLTHTDDKFTRISDCQFGCYLIALQIALGKYSCILDLPANPGIGLDTLQSVIDRVQGLNSRVYVTNRTQEMQFGSNGYWTMELGGALMDTPEAVGVIKDYRDAIKILDRGGKNPWLRKRNGKTLSYGYQDR